MIKLAPEKPAASSAATNNLKEVVEEQRKQREHNSAVTCNRITSYRDGCILRRPSVEARTGLSRSSIYAKLDPKSPYHDASFPRPIKLGSRAVGWREADILVWLDSRVQEKV